MGQEATSCSCCCASTESENELTKDIQASLINTVLLKSNLQKQISTSSVYSEDEDHISSHTDNETDDDAHDDPSVTITEITENYIQSTNEEGEHAVSPNYIMKNEFNESADATDASTDDTHEDTKESEPYVVPCAKPSSSLDIIHESDDKQEHNEGTVDSSTMRIYEDENTEQTDTNKKGHTETEENISNDQQLNNRFMFPMDKGRNNDIMDTTTHSEDLSVPQYRKRRKTISETLKVSHAKRDRKEVNTSEALQVHATCDAYNKYDNSNVGKLSNAWSLSDVSDSKHSKSPKVFKVIKEDASWVKHRTSSTSPHAHHPSIMQLEFNNLVTEAKIYDSLSPTAEGSVVNDQLIRVRSRKRAYSAQK